MDQSGSMIVGVMNRRFGPNKIFGPIINYSYFKGDIVVKVFLDSNKKKLIVYSPANPLGEIFADLPKDGLFYPAVQNKTARNTARSSLKVFFKFERPIPKDKNELGTNLIFSSGEDDPDESEFLEKEKSPIKPR